jgi:hypothetical protein
VIPEVLQEEDPPPAQHEDKRELDVRIRASAGGTPDRPHDGIGVVELTKGRPCPMCSTSRNWLARPPRSPATSHGVSPHQGAGSRTGESALSMPRLPRQKIVWRPSDPRTQTTCLTAHEASVERRRYAPGIYAPKKARDPANRAPLALPLARLTSPIMPCLCDGRDDHRRKQRH